VRPRCVSGRSPSEMHQSAPREKVARTLVHICKRCTLLVSCSAARVSFHIFIPPLGSALNTADSCPHSCSFHFCAAFDACWRPDGPSGWLALPPHEWVEWLHACTWPRLDFGHRRWVGCDVSVCQTDTWFLLRPRLQVAAEERQRALGKRGWPD
jgi:hypothetical protein